MRAQSEFALPHLVLLGRPAHPAMFQHAARTTFVCTSTFGCTPPRSNSALFTAARTASRERASVNRSRSTEKTGVRLCLRRHAEAWRANGSQSTLAKLTASATLYPWLRPAW
eukprot:1091572-Pleurochrysis_carterae.AAC.7